MDNKALASSFNVFVDELKTMYSSSKSDIRSLDVLRENLKKFTSIMVEYSTLISVQTSVLERESDLLINSNVPKSSAV